MQTSILRHPGNRFHDTDEVIFISAKLPEHIQQSTSHNLPENTDQAHDNIRIYHRMF